MVEGKAALEHGHRMQRKRGQQQEIIHVVVLAKTFSPQENRIHRAQPVNHHGEQKEMTVSEPSHADRLNQENRPASGNSERNLTQRRRDAENAVWFPVLLQLLNEPSERPAVFSKYYLSLINFCVKVLI